MWQRPMVAWLLPHHWSEGRIALRIAWTTACSATHPSVRTRVAVSSPPPSLPCPPLCAPCAPQLYLRCSDSFLSGELEFHRVAVRQPHAQPQAAASATSPSSLTHVHTHTQATDTSAVLSKGVAPPPSAGNGSSGNSSSRSSSAQAGDGSWEAESRGEMGGSEPPAQEQAADSSQPAVARLGPAVERVLLQRKVGPQAGKLVGRQAGRLTGWPAGRLAGRQAGGPVRGSETG